MDLTTLHSHMRHLIFLLGFLSLVVTAVFFFKRVDLPKWTKVLVRGYGLVLTIQFLIGIVNLISQWGVPEGSTRYRMEHAAIMLTAVGIVHFANKYMRLPAPLGPRNTMILMAGTIVLIVLGILMLPQGASLLVG